MAATRPRVLKLRLSGDELGIVRVRAQGEPAAVWLRRLALDGAPPPKRRQRAPERPVPPAIAELTRAVVLAGNHLHRLTAELAERGLMAAELIAALDRLDIDLTHALELTRC